MCVCLYRDGIAMKSEIILNSDCLKTVFKEGILLRDDWESALDIKICSEEWNAVFDFAYLFCLYSYRRKGL